ncbi:hypothetical protein IMCC3317_30350 [Kordia antarctica]|uniref:Uncharacterized protein n=1 Tax=Kordia antarctica TaxID=1218801 RepID=A0A7L4ZP22_9FLAO|nr:hypothetical protein [Kordia antarctica]QHI37654.1 hypothetical protein IMCC3317_30350 [Kordia antarctica]
MKKRILEVKGVTELTKKEQTLINGSAGPIAFCGPNGDCPPGSTCDGDYCYADGGGNPGGGNCHEPTRFCIPPETGCGCVYC